MARKRATFSYVLLAVFASQLWSFLEPIPHREVVSRRMLPAVSVLLPFLGAEEPALAVKTKSSLVP